MSWRRNFADYQNSLSQKSADKLIEEFTKCYSEAADEIIPMFIEVYEQALASVDNKRNLTPATLFNLRSYWTLQITSKEKVNELGHRIIALMNSQFHIMYADVFEGITPGGIELPCFIPAETIQEVIDGVWGVDKRNWRDRVWMNMTHLWDKTTGEFMESAIKHRNPEIVQTKLKEVFEGSRKSLNSTMMIDVSRIQAKAAMMRYKVSREMAVNMSADIAAYAMTYGDESEVSTLSMRDVAAVNILSDAVQTYDSTGERAAQFFSIAVAAEDEGGDAPAFDSAAGADQYYMWVCEADDLVCDDCAALDGEILLGEEADAIYPIHPNCRCVLVPVFEDDDDGEDDQWGEDDINGGSGAGGGQQFMDELGGYLNFIGAL